MGKKLIIFILILLFCSALYADSPKDIRISSLPLLDTTTYPVEVPLTVEAVNELIDLRYGATIDRLVHYSNLFIAIVTLGIGTFFIAIWQTTEKKIQKGADEVKKTAAELEVQKEEYSILLKELNDYKENYKNILIMDLVDEARELVDFSVSNFRKDGLAMKRIEALESISALPQDLQIAKSAILFRQGKYAEALEIVESIKNQVPANPDLFFKSGFCKQMMGEEQQALKDYEHAIELDNKNTPSMINRSIIHINQGKYSEAIKGYLQVLDIDSTNKAAWQGLTNATLKTGDLNRAEKIFEIAEKNGIAIDDYLQINRICLWSLQGKFDDCEAPLLDYVAKYPERIIEVLEDVQLKPLFDSNPRLYERINNMLFK